MWDLRTCTLRSASAVAACLTHEEGRENEDAEDGGNADTNCGVELGVRHGGTRGDTRTRHVPQDIDMMNV